MDTNSVLSILLRYVNGQYKKDTNYDIALALLTHYSEIPKKTINEISDLCYVSPASISRFVKLIGFHSFQEFKNACLNTLDISKTDYSPKVIKANKNDVKEILQHYTNRVINNIQFSYDHLDFEQLDRICSYIHDSDDVLILGLEFSTLLAQHVQNRFALMNKYISVAISNEEQLESAHALKEGSTVIILSVEGGYFYRHNEVIQILLEKKVKLVVLTMNEHQKMINEFIDREVILCSQDNTNTESRISLLYTLEIKRTTYKMKFYRQMFLYRQLLPHKQCTCFLPRNNVALR